MALKDIRQALRAYLLADATVSSTVGGTRIHFQILPQERVTPAVVFTRISGFTTYSMDEPSGLIQTRMQIDCWAEHADTCEALANLVKERIDGARGTVAYGASSPQDSLVLRGSFMASEQDGFDPESKLFRMQRDFFIWYSER